MAQATNTYDQYSAIGIKENLSNIISRIDPIEVPFQSNIGKMSVTQTYFEHQTQALAAASGTNAHIDGDDSVSAAAATPTVRVGNRTQIFKKTFVVSGTLDATDAAGRSKESSYQALLKGLELRRDMETTLTGNYASVAGTSTQARKTAGLEAWLTTNTSRGTSGADGGFSSGVVAAATDGTQRTYTETLLKTVNQAVYTAGGRATMLMMGPASKVIFSSFAGLATTRVNDPKGQTTIIGGADRYVSDFGTLTTTVNLFQRDRSALLVDPKKAKIATLRPMKQEKLAKTGDADKYHIVCEAGLMVENEAAFGVVADLS